MKITIEYVDKRLSQLEQEHKEQGRGQTLEVKQALNMQFVGAKQELELIRKELNKQIQRQ